MFVIKIEVAPRVVRLLRFGETSNPVSTAQNFCFQNSLDDSAIDAIAKFVDDFRNLDLGLAFANKQWKLRDLKSTTFDLEALASNPRLNST